MDEGHLSKRDRSHPIGQTIEKALSQHDAAYWLGIGLRQFKRLARVWRQRGDAGLVNRQRGQAAHNRLPEATRPRIEPLLRERYPDFGPTLAAEKLAERDGIAVSRETVRRIQTRLKLHRPKARRAKRVF